MNKYVVIYKIPTGIANQYRDSKVTFEASCITILERGHLVFYRGDEKVMGFNEDEWVRFWREDND